MGIEERNGEDQMRYLIVRPEKGGIRDLFRFLVVALGKGAGAKFLESSEELGAMTGDHRWVIVVSIIVRKIIAVVGKPMEWTGYFLEFLLNLVSDNGDLPGLFYNLLLGKVVIPRRNSETFISAIGHLDGRVDLYKDDYFLRDNEEEKNGDSGLLALMDLCMMASKLAYENAKVVRNIVDVLFLLNIHLEWTSILENQRQFPGMVKGFVRIILERSTQVFILCDKPKDADLILISFRGTEPFDADDWSTDFDYSWYEIPKLGKVHMGFLEALGLGNRAEATTFQNHLQVGGYPLKDMKQYSEFTSSNGLDVTAHPSEGSGSDTCFDTKCGDHSEGPSGEKKLLPDMVEMTAYYAVRIKLKSLLDEHKNAKFVVTGHSLGGALAILFPTVLLLHEEKEMMQRLMGVYTFGQPRVGNRQLGRFMEAHVNHPVPKYFRVVYCNDLVPRLPYDDRTFLYKHFGLCLYYNSCYIEQVSIHAFCVHVARKSYDSTEKVEEEPNRNYFGILYLIPEYLNAAWELVRSLTMGYTHGPEYKEGWFSILLRVVGLVLPGISAHSPTNYINSVRLGREQAQLSSN
ncbi:hypothetical protein HHK36_014480 [Tetracentron sinense]|uniref:Fungal lipase-type domain-containing protein n=1 Tax=Tetracentron sinense TaxID=13715 RepID=A0A835DFF4_TETSI|nr:hypothetical protein HHK36_014480 [Tetracentron sinense]